MDFLRRLSAVLAAMIVLLISGCGGKEAGGTGTKAETKQRLKLVSYYNKDLPIIGETVTRFAERAGKASGGSLEIKVYDPDELVGRREILDAVSTGKVDAGYSAAGFWMGKMPAAPLFSSVPFGPGTGEYLAWFYHGNGMKLYQEMYDRAGFKVKVFVLALLPPETSGWFGKEITSVEDLDGLKMRIFGLGGSVFEKLGVSVNSNIGGGEIFPALEKGILDATEFSMPVIDEDLQFFKLVRFNYFPGWHQQTTALELIVNREIWDGLSPAQQTVIEIACRDGIVFSTAKGDGAQSGVMRRNAEERGVTNAVWSPELLGAFREKWDEVVAEQSAADPFFKEVWEDLRDFRAGYKDWHDLGYLREEGR